MTPVSLRRLLAGLLLVLAALPVVAAAQPTASDPMAPRQPIPAPPGLSFPVPPQIATSELTLPEAVTIALDNQPQIQARLGDYLAALQRVNQALSPMLPQLAASAAGSHGNLETRNINPPPFPNVFTQTVQTVGSGRITLSQLLWDFGKTWAGTQSAKASAEASREDVELQKDLIVLAVKEQYFNLLFASRLVVVNAQALERAELNLRSAKGFFEVGTRPKSDVTRAEVDVANARVDLIRAQNAVSLARIALNTAMGIAVNSPTRVRDILTYEKYAIDQNTLVAEALSRRPEYRSVKFLADAAELNVKSAFRDFFPGFFGTASAGGSTAKTDTGIATYTESGDWVVGVEMRWAIFDGGNKIARWKEAKASVDAAKARIRDTELTIWQEVEGAYVRLVEAEERIGAAQKAVESAQENFRLFQGRFDAGVGNIIELTDAQLALTQAQSTEAQALADFRIAIARLERAMGRR
jgi:outer membrane protein TolC